MDRHHNATHCVRPVADEARRDALVDALWLGGEAIVAPACRVAEEPYRSRDDWPDPDWQVF